MKSCQVVIDIKEVDAVLDITAKQWDDAGNRLPDMSKEDFQELFDSVQGKTRFYIDLLCNGKKRSIRSPLASETDRKFVLTKLISEIIGQSISAQFDNLCQ